MTERTRKRVVVLMGAMVVAFAAVASHIPWLPEPLAPQSVLMFIYLAGFVSMLDSLLYSSVLIDFLFFYLFAGLIPALFYLGWSISVAYSNSDSIPWRSLLLALLLAAASMVFFNRMIPWGVEYQGMTYTLIVVAENAGLALLLLTLWIKNRLRASCWDAIVFNIALFVWLVWCSFPWLGEPI